MKTDELGAAEWTERFKSRLKTQFGLKKKDGQSSSDPSCADFALGPRPEWAHCLYMECRWEPQSANPSLTGLERNVARIVLQLRKQYKDKADAVCNRLRESVDATLDVRIGQEGNTIYVTQTELPELDRLIAPFQQAVAVAEYGNACVRLQKIWRDVHALLDATIAMK